MIATTAAEIGRDARFATQAESHAVNAYAPSDPIHFDLKEATR